MELLLVEEGFQSRNVALEQKSVNLQYIMRDCLDGGTNESSTKRLMFQVLFFSIKSLKKHFQLTFLSNYKNENKEFLVP